MNQTDTTLSIFYSIDSVFILAIKEDNCVYLKYYIQNDPIPDQTKLYPELNSAFSFDPILHDQSFNKILFTYGGLPHDLRFGFTIPQRISDLNKSFSAGHAEQTLYQNLLFQMAKKFDKNLVISKRNQTLYVVGQKNNFAILSNQYFVKKGVDIVYYLQLILNQYPDLESSILLTGDFERDKPLSTNLSEMYPGAVLLSTLTNSPSEEALKPFLPELFYLDENH